MNFDFLENITAPKKPDPKQVRKQQMRSREIHISLKALLCAFAVLIVLLVSVSVYTISKERSKAQETETALDGQTALSDFESEAVKAISPQEEMQQLNGNILIAFTREDTENLQMLAVVNADSETGKVKIAYIPTSTRCIANNHDATMKEHLAGGGITELLWAVSDTYNLNIGRYLYCDEEDLVDIMEYIGDVPVNIEKTISHDYNGINFIIEQGEQNFTAEMFLKYFVYLCDTHTQSTPEITKMLTIISKSLLSFEQYGSSPDETYDKIINYVTTDISAMDITNYLPAIKAIADAGGLENIEIVPDISSLVSDDDNS